MPESETEHLDYYPAGWSEEIHDEYYVEWICDDDQTILVRLDGTMGDGDYTVTRSLGEYGRRRVRDCRSRDCHEQRRSTSQQHSSML